MKILKGNIVEVEDNGRGIPVDIHPKHNKSALEIVTTVLHAGGKFEKNGYKVSGGLHGVGISVVNALSEWMEVEVSRQGKVWYQKYFRGKPVGNVKEIGESDKTGTKVRFMADEEIFETLEYEKDVLCVRLKELAYLNRGLEIEVFDERSEENYNESFKYDGGIVDFIKELEEDEKMIIDYPIYMSGEEDDVTVEIAMIYTESQRESIYSFVNNINTHEGGTHVSGFKTALTRVMNDISKEMNLIKEKENNFQGSDVREGLAAVINVKVPEPQFDGQTKSKLGKIGRASCRERV